ncbi:MAG: 30S ribosomal protein S12 methylthiotransferase RimO [Spirochaetaceae bacterium]|nr:MAG: 30S ribosomal protein S12 methylthiotransferase RimO [Spirochaetaceae bacterium]
MSSSSRSTRRFFIENLGCAKNQVDAEVMIAALERDAWECADDPGGADVILVNSCGFIEPAKQESIDVTLAMLHDYPDARVVVTGCLSQRYPDELVVEIPELAGVFGNRAPHRIAEFLRTLDAGGTRVSVPDAALDSHERSRLLSLPGSAYVKVSEGCDNRCSFCAIPLIRGRARSKPLDAIVTEVRTLVDRGIREINLVAQDLASYGADRDASQAGRSATGETLLRAISQLPGEFWVRLLYVYPDRFPEGFLDIVRDDPRILPYFDIPFQHASTAVLRRMARPGTADGYLDLVSRIRDALPDVFLRSTFLVGFFGEDDAAFDELLEFQQRVQLDWLGVFPYSPEDGTRAMKGSPPLDVSPELALRRADTVAERQRPITHERVERLVGRTLDVLVEELVPQEPLALGRCYAQAPDVDGAVVIHVPDPADGPMVVPGDFIRCRIVRRNGLDVEAVPL